MTAGPRGLYGDGGCVLTLRLSTRFPAEGILHEVGSDPKIDEGRRL